MVLVFEAFNRTTGRQQPEEMFLAAVAGGFVAGHVALIWTLLIGLGIALISPLVFGYDDRTDTSVGAQNLMAVGVFFFLAIGAFIGIRLAGVAKRVVGQFT
jgi:hypothetical protein